MPLIPKSIILQALAATKNEYFLKFTNDQISSIMKTILKSLYSLLSLFPRKKKLVKRYQISTKNKWLYPEDNFGKMERGIEFKS